MSKAQSKNETIIPRALINMSNLQAHRKVVIMQIESDTYCLLPKESSNMKTPIGVLKGNRLTIPAEIFDENMEYHFDVRYGTIQMKVIPKK